MTKLFFIIISIFISQNLFASQNNSIPIAVVDMQKILRDSNVTKNIREQIEKKRAEYQAQINKQENELKKKTDDLSKQRSILSEEAFEGKTREFNQRVAEVQKGIQQKRVSLDQAYMKAMSKVEGEILNIIESISHANRYQIVMPTSQILFAVSEIEITEEVLRKLNSKLSQVNVEVKEISSDELEKYGYQ